MKIKNTADILSGYIESLIHLEDLSQELSAAARKYLLEGDIRYEQQALDLSEQYNQLSMRIMRQRNDIAWMNKAREADSSLSS